MKFQEYNWDIHCIIPKYIAPISLAFGAQQATMSCPELAKQVVTITRDGMDSIVLSTYERTVGTIVDVTCLMDKAYVLNGGPRLTCLAGQEWDKPQPNCTIKTDFIEQTTGTGSSTPSSVSGGLGTILITGISVGAVAVIALLVLGIVLCRMCYIQRKRKEYSVDSKPVRKLSYNNPYLLPPWDDSQLREDVTNVPPRSDNSNDLDAPHSYKVPRAHLPVISPGTFIEYNGKKYYAYD